MRKLTAATFILIGLFAPTFAQVNNCCQVNRQCHNDADWTNGYYAFQNGQCAEPAQSQAATSAQTGASAQIDNCCFARLAMPYRARLDQRLSCLFQRSMRRARAVAGERFGATREHGASAN